MLLMMMALFGGLADAYFFRCTTASRERVDKYHGTDEAALEVNVKYQIVSDRIGN